MLQGAWEKTEKTDWELLKSMEDVPDESRNLEGPTLLRQNPARWIRHPQWLRRRRD